MDVSTPDGQLTCHATVLQTSADLPARAAMTNMKQFNGKWGVFTVTTLEKQLLLISFTASGHMMTLLSCDHRNRLFKTEERS